MTVTEILTTDTTVTSDQDTRITTATATLADILNDII